MSVSYLKDFFCKTNTSEWTCENAVEYYKKYISPNEKLKKILYSINVELKQVLKAESDESCRMAQYILDYWKKAIEIWPSWNTESQPVMNGKFVPISIVKVWPSWNTESRLAMNGKFVPILIVFSGKLEHRKSTGHERKHWTSDVKKSDQNVKTIQNHLNERKALVHNKILKNSIIRDQVIRSMLAEHITSKRPAEEASPIITSPNLRDHTQHEQDRPRTPENNLQGEMVLRKKKKVHYTESSSSDYDGYIEGSKDNSRESTPCLTTQTIANTLIITPNKPIITSAIFNQYSMHVIFLKELILKKLEAIFQSDYSEIFSKIIEETATEKDNKTTKESRFLFFIRHTLLDFVAMFKYLTPKILDRDMKERSYIVECLSPILRAFRNAFSGIKYEWIEKDVESIKKVNEIFMSNIGHCKIDLLVLRLSDASKLLMVEVSGPPHKSTKRHTVGDVKKLLMMAICSLCRILANNLDCPINDAKKVRTYSIQAIGKVQRKIRSFIPSADNIKDLQEWLHLPDNYLNL
ncbi:10791_t:CDS:2 [Funneliformis caledonium]|uniref:10791_t:CDS:1 n=1 Tax=Funneliformis caledonium TaxID=1117310 RepID=A0A9N9GD20_9GLOM|nr:10791_t:CDS:2 [Funneliformis caledonium]